MTHAPGDLPKTALQLRSLISEAGELTLSLVSVPVDEPGPEAADMTTASVRATAEGPVVTASVPAAGLRAMAGRLGQSLPVGNEGGGVVVAAGASDAAQALLGRTVGVFGGAMYAQYRTLSARDCLVLGDDVTPAEGASCFVNPLTALGMVETMRAEGHKALVHTAAASNLGQMLNRICQADGVGLVNIVRSPAQEAILRDIGAACVCDSSKPAFLDDLIEALVATGATVAFDAIGGGKLASQILVAMEAALNRTATSYNRYGSATHKQVYIYGGLDISPTILTRSFGMAWGLGGWLLPPFLQKIGPEKSEALRRRVAAEIKTTFASHYTSVISLQEALNPEVIAAYNRRATGEKYLIAPHKAG
jgi:NADPH:quinone reductase-like Zn-dependent oxidoreductase